jgi:6-pyruvoyltetrahydropterin/6-carboxytetrahydropterin synthase
MLDLAERHASRDNAELRGGAGFVVGHTVTLWKSFTFEAAHRLPTVPAGHKCARLHGHSFRLEVHVTGSVDPATGMLVDYADVKDAFAPLHDALDHRYLNEIEGLENPTSENLVQWIWERLHRRLPQLSRLVLQETCTVGCVYEGPARSAGDDS